MPAGRRYRSLTAPPACPSWPNTVGRGNPTGLNPADAATIRRQGPENSTDAGVIAALRRRSCRAVAPQNIRRPRPPAPPRHTRLGPQPWLPLYLEWSDRLLPYSFPDRAAGTFRPDGNGDYQSIRTHWAFDGSDLHDWTGAAARHTGTAVPADRAHGADAAPAPFTFLNPAQGTTSPAPRRRPARTSNSILRSSFADFDILSQTLNRPLTRSWR